MSRPRSYPPEIRERAVRLVFEQEPDYPSQWAAVRSIAEKSGMASETLRKWVREAERNEGRRPGLKTDERERLCDLQNEVKEAPPRQRGPQSRIGLFGQSRDWLIPRISVYRTFYVLVGQLEV